MGLRVPRRFGVLAVVVALAAPQVVVGATRAGAADETWVRRASAATPPARTLPAMAYDAVRKEIVMFGGYGPAGNNPQRTDTWVWDGDQWAQRTTATSPGHCPAAEMAYDAARAQTVLFCGYQGTGTGRTWTWDGVAWTPRFPATTPSARQHYVLVYDEARGETVLFGGRANTGGRLNDTWAWTGSNWVLRPTPVSPPVRDGAAATYDSDRGEVVVFGGTGNAGPLADTWTWDGTTWTLRPVATAPPARWTATMAYDVVRGGAILFGGVAVTTNALHDDTWVWHGAQWTKLDTVTRPPGRYFAASAFHTASARTLVYGGSVAVGTGFTEADDTWTLDAVLPDCGMPDVAVLPQPAGDLCCEEMPTDAEGNLVLPPGETAEFEPEVETEDGRVVDLYPQANPASDEWYSSVDCPWSIGGEVPAMGDFTDVEGQLSEAGFTSSPAELAEAFDRQSEELLLQVDRPSPVDLMAQGPIGQRCTTWLDAVDPVRTASAGVLAPVESGASASAAAPPATAKCEDPRPRPAPAGAPFKGRDVIFVHGLMPGSIVDRINGDPASAARWPADRNEFTSPSGYWKQQANAYWNAHITRYLKHGVAGGTPTNRYLVVSWASTQSLGHGIHAFLTQAAEAMANGDGVMTDATGSIDGFCARGCVVQSHSTGAPLVDAALAVARASGPWSPLGDLRWIPQRMTTHVSYMGAFGGSHYATVAAALGWAAAFTTPLCELIAWVMQNLIGITVPCARRTVIAESVLTDLAVPVMHALWRPLAGLTPVPTLLVSAAHPTAVGTDGFAKTVSPIVKMLFHHGLDDGVLSMDSQCATSGDWRDAPQSVTTRPTVADVAGNAALRSHQLPAVLAARAYDMGNSSARSIPFYVDQVVGAQIGTPQFWKALVNGTLQEHFNRSPYRTAAACHNRLTPTGMVLENILPRHPGSASQDRLPNHYSFIMAASDHRTAATGPFDTLCYEVTSGSGRSCAGAANTEEVPAIDDPAVFSRGLVSSAFNDEIDQVTRGKPIKLFRKKTRRWWWKRTYHVLHDCDQRIAPDYVYAFVLS